MPKVQTMARIDATLREAAEKAAQAENRSLSNWIEEAIRDRLIQKGYISGQGIDKMPTD